MAGTVTVTHEQLLAQAKQLATTKNNVEAALNSAGAQIRQLHAENAFIGEAGDSFQTVYAEWENAAKKTVEILNDFGTHLTKTSGAFQEVDSAMSLKV